MASLRRKKRWFTDTNWLLLPSSLFILAGVYFSYWRQLATSPDINYSGSLIDRLRAVWCFFLFWMLCVLNTRQLQHRLYVFFACLCCTGMYYTRLLFKQLWRQDGLEASRDTKISKHMLTMYKLMGECWAWCKYHRPYDKYICCK